MKRTMILKDIYSNFIFLYIFTVCFDGNSKDLFLIIDSGVPFSINFLTNKQKMACFGFWGSLGKEGRETRSKKSRVDIRVEGLFLIMTCKPSLENENSLFFNILEAISNAGFCFFV
jgi:hypothetical protein